MSLNYLELDTFQFESVVMSYAIFRLFVFEEALEVPEPKKIFFQRAEKVEPQVLIKKLQEEAVALEFPIVLICSDGHVSGQIAKDLSDNGFKNICVLAGGARAFLEED